MLCTHHYRIGFALTPDWRKYPRGVCVRPTGDRLQNVYKCVHCGHSISIGFRF